MKNNLENSFEQLTKLFKETIDFHLKQVIHYEVHCDDRYASMHKLAAEVLTSMFRLIVDRFKHGKIIDYPRIVKILKKSRELNLPGIDIESKNVIGVIVEDIDGNLKYSQIVKTSPFDIMTKS